MAACWRLLMRIFYILVLLILVSIVGILALENREVISFRFFGQSLSGPQALLIAIVYLVGMVSGWFVIGIARRLIRESV